MFLVKYDQSGNILWAKSYGNGNAAAESYYMKADAAGNTFVTGMFRSSQIVFDTDTLINSYPGYDEIFVIKLDANGNIIWAMSAGGDSNDDGFSIALDASDNVYVAGQFQSSTINFGNDTLINANPGPADVFVAKIDTVVVGIRTLTKNNNSVEIFPNPFSNSATLVINGEINNNASLCIFDLMGREVQSLFIGNEKEIKIDKDNLTHGMYFYKLTTNKNETIATGKIVIE
jgi:hypothetical protein